MRPFTLLAIIISLFAVSAVVSAQSPSPPKPKKTTVRGNPAPPPALLVIPKNETDAEGFFGSFEEGVYKNEFFGFEVAVPADYRVLNNVEVEQYKNVNKDHMKMDNERDLKRYDKAVDHTAILLGIVRNTSDLSKFVAMEVDAGRQPQGVTPNMALLAASSVLTGTGKYKTEQLLPDLMIGERKFVGVELSTDLLGRTLKCRLYATIVRDYALLVAATYFDEQATDDITELFKAVKFHKK
jgi:hypothetical protein